MEKSIYRNFSYSFFANSITIVDFPIRLAPSINSAFVPLHSFFQSSNFDYTQVVKLIFFDYAQVVNFNLFDYAHVVNLKFFDYAQVVINIEINLILKKPLESPKA